MKNCAFYTHQYLNRNIVDSQVIPLLKENDILISNHTELSHCHKVLGLWRFLLNYKRLGIDRVYTRDCQSFIKIFVLRLLSLSKFKIIYDFRALLFIEEEFKNKNKIKVFSSWCLECFGYKHADLVGAVSYNLAKELKSRFNLQRNIIVFPCCAKKNIRRELELGKRLLYVGGLSLWQNFEAILEIYKQLRVIDAGYSLTVVTKDQEAAKCFIKAKELEGIEVMSVPHSDMFDLMCKFDFGFIVRDEHLLNKVSSPIKLAEYVCAGVIPILTDNIGDLSRELLNKKLAVLYSKDANEVNQKVVQFIGDFNEKKSNELYEFSKNYSWENIKKQHVSCNSHLYTDVK